MCAIELTVVVVVVVVVVVFVVVDDDILGLHCHAIKKIIRKLFSESLDPSPKWRPKI